MNYISTRGEAPCLGFSDAVLAGLARDGGLYLPQEWPQFSATEIRAMRGLTYQEIALRVLTPFVGGEISTPVLEKLVNEAYATFRHDAVCPLVQLGPNSFVLELFHGPTLAFKDVAMQLLARLMDHVLAERDQHATIVGATSGDTGGAAIEAFAGRNRTDIFILFPHGKVSPVQQRQMTTSTADNVHALAIEGNFDDCQGLVKELFNDHGFRDRVALSGVNSINWARIVAQAVYYFTAAVALGAPHRKMSFTVPTGNFGDIFAGYVAKRMGLPVDRLIVATNTNDILARTLATGIYEPRDVVATSSPSMDIQVSSNFERLLFEANGRDAAAVRALMNSLTQSKRFTVAPQALAAIRSEFSADRASEEEVAATIRTLLRETGQLIDPHTAVGVAVAEKEQRDPALPMIVLSTAHAAKFPEAVQAACGVKPALPDWLGDLEQRAEKVTHLPADQNQIERCVLAASRAAKEGAAA